MSLVDGIQNFFSTLTKSVKKMLGKEEPKKVPRERLGSLVLIMVSKIQAHITMKETVGMTVPLEETAEKIAGQFPDAVQMIEERTNDSFFNFFLHFAEFVEEKQKIANKKGEELDMTSFLEKMYL